MQLAQIGHIVTEIIILYFDPALTFHLKFGIKDLDIPGLFVVGVLISLILYMHTGERRC